MEEYELVRCITPRWCVVFKASSGTYLDLWLRGDSFLDLVELVTPFSPVKCLVELGKYQDGTFRDSIVIVDNVKRRGSAERHERASYYKKRKN